MGMRIVQRLRILRMESANLVHNSDREFVFIFLVCHKEKAWINFSFFIYQ